MKLSIEIERDEDGFSFIATVPALPGCITQGSTLAEARANAREAIAGHLASLRHHGEAVPPPVEG
jgi:predicted RNase H-like HicB family nuclease